MNLSSILVIPKKQNKDKVMRIKVQKLSDFGHYPVKCVNLI